MLGMDHESHAGYGTPPYHAGCGTPPYHAGYPTLVYPTLVYPGYTPPWYTHPGMPTTLHTLYIRLLPSLPVYTMRIVVTIRVAGERELTLLTLRLEEKGSSWQKGVLSPSGITLLLGRNRPITAKKPGTERRVAQGS